MQIFYVHTKEGVFFVRALTAMAAYNTIVQKVGTDAIDYVRPATPDEITSQEKAA